MNKEDAAKIVIEVLEGIPKPGDLVQIQIPISGGGEQVDIILEQIAHVQLTRSFEDNNFQRIVIFKTTNRTMLTYDWKGKQWFLVTERPGKNLKTPISVFLM